MPGRRWTQEEEDLLDQRADLEAPELAKLLGRSRQAVAAKRCELKKPTLAVAHYVGPRTLVARTCHQCGLVLDASWFDRGGFVKNWHTGWAKLCQPCKALNGGNAASRKKSRKHRAKDPDRANQRTKNYTATCQATSLVTATKHRDPWTAEDHKVASNPNLTRMEKAVALRRTFVAVSSYMSKNGLGSKAGKGDPMLVRWIIDNPAYAADPSTDGARILDAYHRWCLRHDPRHEGVQVHAAERD